MKAKVLVALEYCPFQLGICVWEKSEKMQIKEQSESHIDPLAIPSSLIPTCKYEHNLNLATRLTSPCWINLLYSVNLGVFDFKYHLLNPLYTKAYLLLIFK